MLPPVTPQAYPLPPEVQALAGTEAGRELGLGLPLPLTGVRLARCYLPWVNLAVTQVPPCGRTCPGDKGLTPSICHGLALLGRACMSRLPWDLRTLGLDLFTPCTSFKKLRWRVLAFLRGLRP